jgi:enoyl-CoA hydratase
LTSDVLTVHSEGAVRVVTLNRPDRGNAIDKDLHTALENVWRELETDLDARAVVLTGAGAMFCSGGDIESFDESLARAVRRRNLSSSIRLAHEMIRFNLPVVAAVNGPAVGLGCSLAAMSDIVLIAEGAFMSDPHVAVGLVAADGGPLTWPLLMGLLRAKEYLLLGERIPSAKAVELGLATREVAPERLMDEAMAVAERLAQLPPQAVQDTKRAINLHIQQAATAILPFAFAAESESIISDEVAATVQRFRDRGV